jgi:hypothetical protein
VRDGRGRSPSQDATGRSVEIWWGMEMPMLMLMFARSIGREMGLWRVCTRAVEYWREITRPRGQRCRYQLVEVVEGAVSADETRGMRMVLLGLFT